MADDIYVDSISLKIGENVEQWPKLSCSQANQLALEVSDLRLDANREILFQGNGQLTASGDMLFLTGGSSPEKLRILADGNVGIGTPNPSYKLAIAAGDINIDDKRALRQAGRWVIGGDSNVLSIGSSDNSDGRDIRFDLGFAGALTIKKDTGNVGIGTTNPVSKLSIFSTQPDQSGGMIHLQVTEPFSGGHRPLTIAKRNSANTARLDWTFEVSEGDNPGLSIFRVLRSNATSPSLVMPLHLTWDGNVGIGTIPKQIFAGSDSSRVATPLTIKATGVSQGLITFEDASGTPTWHINQKLGGTISGLNFAETKVADGRLFIAAGGNVGIGTTSPGAKLHIHGSSTSATNLLLTRDGDGPYMRFEHNGRLAEIQFSASTSANLLHISDGTGRFIGNIALQGNVGIRTVNPQYPLHVNGEAYCTGRKWVEGSSIDYKEDVVPLTLDKALETLANLNPVTFRYKVEEDKKYVGFIAEEVPDLVASKDRKGLSSMDIVGILTKVVQHQQKEIEQLKTRLNECRKFIA